MVRELSDATVVLDESKFGHTDDELATSYYCFYHVDKNGNKKYITRRKCSGTVLIAVTKEQFKQWAGRKIVSELENL